MTETAAKDRPPVARPRARTVTAAALALHLDFTLETSDLSSLPISARVSAEAWCNGTGMRNDRLFQAVVIAAGVISVGAVAAPIFYFLLI
jgi:hypothetical protein